MSLKVAVIGVGYLGQHHARVYSEIEDAELVGVVDTDMIKAEEAAKRHGSKAYKDYRAVLDKADAFSIVVPTTSHYEIALDCIRAGKDVFVEKPIAATVEEADELVCEAERLNRILQVGHLERYNPGVIAVSGMIQEPIFFESLRLSQFLNRATDVDVTIDLMIHDIDIVLSLVSSPIRRIDAVGLSLITEKIDEARAWVAFENGVLASFTVSRISPEKQRKLRIYQNGTYMELDYQNGDVRLFSHIKESNNILGDLSYEKHDIIKGQSVIPFKTIKPEYREPLKEELRDFLQCVANREKPKVSGIEGRDALRVALEINSIIMKGLTGGPVSFPVRQG